MDTFENLTEKLTSKSNIKMQDILDLVDRKYSEMKGLVTKEGALYLVARELNINISEIQPGRIGIKSIVAGMKNLNIVGRIFRISRINEFKKSNGTTGKVVNIFIGDNSGYVRLPLWDEQVKLLEDHTIDLGDIVQVNNSMSRENTFGDVELSLGKYGSINQIQDFMELPSVEELSKIFFIITPEKATISSIVNGGNFQIKGTIVHVFNGNFLFNVCSICNGKVNNNVCAQHGEVSPNHELVVSFILDDGTGDLRYVVFRELAEKLCSITAEELSEMDSERKYTLVKDKILGKELILAGQARKNRMFDRLEMVANEFKDINSLEESKRLVDEIKFMVGG